MLPPAGWLDGKYIHRPRSEAFIQHHGSLLLAVLLIVGDGELGAASHKNIDARNAEPMLVRVRSQYGMAVDVAAGLASARRDQARNTSVRWQCSAALCGSAEQAGSGSTCHGYDRLIDVMANAMAGQHSPVPFHAPYANLLAAAARRRPGMKQLMSCVASRTPWRLHVLPAGPGQLLGSCC